MIEAVGHQTNENRRDEKNNNNNKNKNSGFLLTFYVVDV
jgi:hypothetical protein